MIDFLANNSLYIVLLIALVVWFGVFVYLNRIDSRVKKLESNTSSKS